MGAGQVCRGSMDARVPQLIAPPSLSRSMNLALVTGASGGIGADLARAHAKRGGDLVLVARNGDKLDALANELRQAHGISATVVAMDLTDHDASGVLAEVIEDRELEVEVLINNAGFGGYGPFHEQKLDVHRRMMQLNMVALTELTHRLLPAMVERGHGHILNVGSTAGMVPGPLQAVYYATKAYVNSLTQALAEELRDTGVTATVLCPGPVDTGFAAAANVAETRAFKMQNSDPAEVAEAGYAAMLEGKDLIVVPARLGFLLQKVTPLMPRRFVVRASRRAMEKR